MTGHRFQRRRRVAIITLAALLVMSLLAACGDDDEGENKVGTTSTTGTGAAAATVTPAHWTYEGEEGPEHWGELDSAYAACSEGESQSPIDVASPAEQSLANIAFSYAPSAVNILNNGHTIQVNYDAGSSISLDDTQYDLQQFHFHAPSEHTVDGVEHSAELHLVHRGADGTLAVVGVFIDTGAENATLVPVWENLPAESGPVQATGATVNATDLLPAEQTSFRYDGSLTTPPCSEGVLWFVMSEPISISDAQLAAFEEIIEANHRPVQPLNDREIQEDTSP